MQKYYSQLNVFLSMNTKGRDEHAGVKQKLLCSGENSFDNLFCPIFKIILALAYTETESWASNKLGLMKQKCSSKELIKISSK